MNTILGTTASSQSKFILKTSYANWFNGTNSDFYDGLINKLTDTGDWLSLYGINFIVLYFRSITINGIFYDGGDVTIYDVGGSYDYMYRDDGYGLGMSSYIDALNNILIQYKLRTRFYPAAGNQIIGLINTAENFEVDIPEVASGPDIETSYKIKCVYGEVRDTLFGNYNDGGPWY